MMLKTIYERGGTRRVSSKNETKLERCVEKEAPSPRGQDRLKGSIDGKGQLSERAEGGRVGRTVNHSRIVDVARDGVFDLRLLDSRSGSRRGREYVSYEYSCEMKGGITNRNNAARSAVKDPSCRGENDPCIRPASTRLESIKLLTSIASRDTFRATRWRTCFLASLLSSRRRSVTGPWMRVRGVRSL